MGKPESHVVLHYAASKEGCRDEYRKEEMQHVYGGIYIKAFIIFYGEKINYSAGRLTTERHFIRL